MFTDLCYNKAKKGGELYMNFAHCDKEEKYLTLHDRVAEQAYFENGKLGFEFHEFRHPLSPLPNRRRNSDGVIPYIFLKQLEK